MTRSIIPLIILLLLPLLCSDAEEPEKEEETAPEEQEEEPREMTLEEYKQKHSSVSTKSCVNRNLYGEGGV